MGLGIAMALVGIGLQLWVMAAGAPADAALVISSIGLGVILIGAALEAILWQRRSGS